MGDLVLAYFPIAGPLYNLNSMAPIKYLGM